MAQNYSTWPAYSDVIEQLTAAGIPIRAGVSNSFYTKIIDGVVDELERKTHRQFIADTSDTTRYYDGSGSGEQLVDDMVSLTSVSILGWIGIGAFDVTNSVLFEEKSYPRNKIYIARGPSYQYNYGVFSRFPEGRGNIKVVGRFGFSLYIPDSVWLAVRARASTLVAGHFLAESDSGRIIKSWIEGSSSEKYVDGDLQKIGEVQGWIEQWKSILRDFKKPLNERYKPSKKVMI